jgi:hypothetical protein
MVSRNGYAPDADSGGSGFAFRPGHRLSLLRFSRLGYNLVCAVCSRSWMYSMLVRIKARTLLEDICDKPIVIQSYCALARLHGV